MLAADVVVIEGSRLVLGESERAACPVRQSLETFLPSARPPVSLRRRPPLNGGSRPDPTRGQLGLGPREVWVRGRELIHALSRDAEEGRYLGDTHQVVRHPTKDPTPSLIRQVLNLVDISEPELSTVVGSHACVTLGGVAIEVGSEIGVEDRNEALECCSSHEPLEVRPSRMVIWTVEAGSWDDLDEAMEETLVTCVHPNGDGGLTAVPAEAALSDQDADEEADIEEVGEMIGQRSPSQIVSEALLHRMVSRETRTQTCNLKPGARIRSQLDRRSKKGWCCGFT